MISAIKGKGVLIVAKSFEDFKKYMEEVCGMAPPDDEPDSTTCSECLEPILKSDYYSRDWRSCPCCEYDIITECYPDDDEEEFEE